MINLLDSLPEFVRLFFSFNLLIFTILIVTYNLLYIIFRDLKYIKSLGKFEDPQTISMEELKDLPLVNFIIPAWKEGEDFKECLKSITGLNYPYLKVIINAGGSEETINIANSFEVNEKFIILLIKKKEGGKLKQQMMV